MLALACIGLHWLALHWLALARLHWLAPPTNRAHVGCVHRNSQSSIRASFVVARLLSAEKKYLAWQAGRGARRTEKGRRERAVFLIPRKKASAGRATIRRRHEAAESYGVPSRPRHSHDSSQRTVFTSHDLVHMHEERALFFFYFLFGPGILLSVLCSPLGWQHAGSYVLVGTSRASIFRYVITFSRLYPRAESRDEGHVMKIRRLIGPASA